MVSKLINEVSYLKNDNVYMKKEIKNLPSLLEVSPKAFPLWTSEDQYIVPLVDATNSPATQEVPLPAPSISCYTCCSDLDWRVIEMSLPLGLYPKGPRP
jgi:hypothetical protein